MTTVNEILYPYDTRTLMDIFNEDPVLAAHEILRLQHQFGLSSWEPLTDRLRDRGDMYWRLQFNTVLVELQRLSARYADLERATQLHFKLDRIYP